MTPWCRWRTPREDMCLEIIQTSMITRYSNTKSHLCAKFCSVVIREYINMWAVFNVCGCPIIALCRHGSQVKLLIFHCTHCDDAAHSIVQLRSKLSVFYCPAQIETLCIPLSSSDRNSLYSIAQLRSKLCILLSSSWWNSLYSIAQLRVKLSVFYCPVQSKTFCILLSSSG